MRIVVDTSRDITRLFEIISDNIRNSDTGGVAILENCIMVSAETRRIKNIVAHSVAEFIAEKYERDIVLGYIKEFELLKHEAEEILGFIKSDFELYQKRMELLKKELLIYISSGRVNVDGIVAFRLNEYKEELKFAAEMFIDEISVKKSYDEFIGLMKYFTEIQQPGTDAVVLSEESGEYELTDVAGNPLKLRFDEEFADELMPIGLTGEDLLISNLMAAMPGKIIFKNVNEEKPIINTISRIFEGRITH